MSVTTPVDPGAGLPAAPGTPTFTAVGNGSLTVNWTAAAGAGSYKVERAPDVSGAPGAWTQLAGGVTALSYYNGGLAANTPYWYRVRATNAGGDGPYSTASSVTTLPNAPGTPTFSNVAYNSATVNWTAPGGGTVSYTVQRGTGQYGPWTQLAAGVTALSYTDATLVGNATYWYHVGATNATGVSYSASASVTTPVDPGAGLPAAPGTPTFTAVGNGSLTVSRAIGSM